MGELKSEGSSAAAAAAGGTQQQGNSKVALFSFPNEMLLLSSVDLPLALLCVAACAVAICGIALLVSQRYGAAQVWSGPFYDSDPGGVCESAREASSVLRPVNAMASAAYFVVGIVIITLAAVDATRLIKAGRNEDPSVRLLSRVPAWSAIWGLWTVTLGGSSFAYFVMASPDVAYLMQFSWWALGAHIIAYAWARFLIDRPKVHEIGCSGCVCIVHVVEGWWFDRCAFFCFLLIYIYIYTFCLFLCLELTHIHS